MPGKEKKFENKIKDYLKSKGCWYVKYWGGPQFTKSGIPDLLCCINGFFVAIEVKASNGKVSEIQHHQIEQIRVSCGIAITVYPDQWEQLKELIDRLNKNIVSNNWFNQKEFDRRQNDTIFT